MDLLKLQIVITTTLTITLVIIIILLYFSFKTKKTISKKCLVSIVKKKTHIINNSSNKIASILHSEKNIKCNIENNNNFSVTIVGTARDIEPFIYNSIKKLEMIANIFQNSNIIIYENDSIDKTLRILQKWAKNSKYNIKIISEKNVPGKRTHRLAHGRNILLNEALILNNDYFVVIDLDNVINDLTIDSFNTCFNYNNIDWAMLGANQEEFYYDIWALRTKDNWLNFDWAKCHYDLGDTNFCLKSRIRKLKIQDELIEVDSCFGGLAIYKTKYLKNCKYYGGDDDDEICEHVPFHDDIRRKNNGRIFINTKLINCLKYN